MLCGVTPNRVPGMDFDSATWVPTQTDTTKIHDIVCQSLFGLCTPRCRLRHQLLHVRPDTQKIGRGGAAVWGTVQCGVPFTAHAHAKTSNLLPQHTRSTQAHNANPEQKERQSRYAVGIWSTPPSTTTTMPWSAVALGACKSTLSRRVRRTMTDPRRPETCTATSAALFTRRSTRFT